MKANEVEACALGDDTKWAVECPFCGRMYDCSGRFMPEDPYHCECGEEFYAIRLVFGDGSYIE